MAESRTHDDLLKEIKDRYALATQAWASIREEGRTDIKFIAGDPWSVEDKQARGNRPTLSLDELGQYVNQAINEVRLNNRSIKVTSLSSELGGKADKLADVRANLIRQIEYRSNARQQAYTTMFEGAVQRSFGWLRIVPRYVADDALEQELLIQEIPNPDLVTPDPDHQMADGSDLKYLFFHETYDEDEFSRKWPNAKYKSFGGDEIKALAPGWIKGQKVTVAEYWKKQVRERELLLIQGANGQPEKVYRDELTAGANPVILGRRKVQATTVVQYITNGLEILAGPVEWPGKHLPFVPCYGKVLFVEDGGTITRKILSLVRLARDPFKYYCYIRSSQAEILGQPIKVPWFIRKGSLSAQYKQALEDSASQPVGVIEVEGQIPDMPGTPPEMPVRPDTSLRIQEYEVLAEGARRAIQAAMGTSPLPTSAQRRNEKSGKALQQIEEAGQKGSFHFTDHYEASIRRTGEILNDLLPHYYDTPRDVAVRKPDDTTHVLRINDPAAIDPETKQPELISLTEGQFDVTIGTGPTFDSQREEASNFADVLMGTPFAQQVADLAVKLKNLGPIGEEIADRLTPAPFRKPKDGQIDPTLMAQQLQQAQQAIDMLTKELDARTQQIQTDEVKARKDIEIAKMDNATKVLIAEMQLAAKGLQSAQQHQQALEEQAIGRSFDAADAHAQQSHDAAMSQMQHAQAMEQGQQGHQQALEQGAQQAALRPMPTPGGVNA